MAEITLPSTFVLSMLTEIGRSRALAPNETDVIEDCIAIEITPFRWNPRLDVALKVASHSPGGIARFARRHGIAPHTAHMRLYRMRKRDKRKSAGKGQKE